MSASILILPVNGPFKAALEARGATPFWPNNNQVSTRRVLQFLLLLDYHSHISASSPVLIRSYWYIHTERFKHCQLVKLTKLLK